MNTKIVILNGHIHVCMYLNSFLITKKHCAKLLEAQIS